MRDMDTVAPVDVPLTHDRTRDVPWPRTELDPPTPLTVQTIYHDIARFLIRVSILRQSATAYRQVQELHEEIIQFNEHLPPFLWAENPDRAFDGHPDCYWLPGARETIDITIGFTILALHRPFIFQNLNSRTQAIRAGLFALKTMYTGAEELPLTKCRSFSYFFATFDAAVTVAAIYVLYPRELPRSFDEAILRLDLTARQFHRMKSLNPLAGRGANVMNSLLGSLRRDRRPSPTQETPGSSSSTFGVVSPDNLMGPISDSGDIDEQTLLSLQDVSPPWPLHDLLFHDLSSAALHMAPYADGQDLQNDFSNCNWQFQGQFQNDTFWDVMNHMSQM